MSMAEMIHSHDKILIIEDNPFDYQFAKKLLHKRNRHLFIEVAYNITDALEILSTSALDLIFLDLNLPDSTGLNSLKLVHTAASQIPIIILTSNDDKETAITALTIGAQDYLIKGKITGSLLERSMRYAFERKQSANKLKSQNDFLHSILESLTHPLIVIDSETLNISVANSAAINHGFHTDFCCCDYSNIQTRPCYSPNGICLVKEIRRLMEPVVYTHAYLNSDGEEKIDEIHGFPLFNASGKLSQVILYFFDISEQEKTKLQYQMLSTVVEQSSDSILITDTEGNIGYANPAFKKVTGYADADIIGENISILYSGRHNHAFYENIQQNLKNGDSWQGKMVSKKRNNFLYEEKTRVSPVKDDNGAIVNHVLISRDITKEKRLESIAEAANLMTNIGYIFSGIRHEIGNPINSIKLALTVLNNNLDKYSREKIYEFTSRSLDEVIRVEYLLKALKNFSMFETLDTKIISIDNFLESFVNLIREDFKKKGIHVKADLSPEPVLGLTDPRALHQVLLNLLTNAADALEGTEKPMITIQVKASEGLVRIEVIDNGCGMSDEEQSNLFKPFYTSKQNGTGLGLVIVKKMLAKMQSTIKIHSSKNFGTRIMLFIPEVDNENISKKKNINY